MIKAIVYTSNTGYTAEYARILGEKTGLPVYSLDKAVKALPKDEEIVYLGWLMAAFVKGLPQALKHFSVKIVCGVCMGESGSQLDSVRKNNGIPEEIPVFTLQGGFDMKKLKQPYKFMMKLMAKHLKNQISQKPTPNEEDKKILNMLDRGASYVTETALTPIIEAMK